MVTTLNRSRSRLWTHTANRRKTDFRKINYQTLTCETVKRFSGHQRAMKKGSHLGCPSQKKRLMEALKDLKAVASLGEELRTERTTGSVCDDKSTTEDVYNETFMKNRNAFSFISYVYFNGCVAGFLSMENIYTGFT